MKADIKTRTTRKEIVDSQQRSSAIFAYYNDKFPISTGSKSVFAGKKFSQLDENDQLNFINYKLGVDLFSAASDSDIREVFRRMYSYTVPLDPAETRYATHQGVFKWFISDITKRYSQTLKDLGVFSEKLLIRMNDSTIFTEISKSIVDGIFSASDQHCLAISMSQHKRWSYNCKTAVCSYTVATTKAGHRAVPRRDAAIQAGPAIK